jgi:hypothetical protein
MQNNFLKGWLINNLIGWEIGCLFTLPALTLAATISMQWFVITRSESSSSIFTIIPATITWLPLSAALGILQGLGLQPLGIKVRTWSLVTIAAWVIPAAVLPWLFDTFHIGNFSSRGIEGQIAGILIVAVSIGVLQASVMRKSFSTSLLWVLAYCVGFFVMSFLTLLTWGIGFGIGKSLMPLFHSLGASGVGIVFNRDILLIGFVFLTAPVWATLAFGLPTGIILSRFNEKQRPKLL